MTYEQWVKRLSSRADITGHVAHLTRSRWDHNPPRHVRAVDVLVEILSSGYLRADGRGFINGGQPVVCFQNTPLYSLAENWHYEAEREKTREGSAKYSGFGLLFRKDVAFAAGARPVIYDEPYEAKQYVRPEDHWRIVSFDLADRDHMVDWTHEREWRHKGDFRFDVAQATILVPDPAGYRAFMDHPVQRERRFTDRAAGMTVLSSVFY